ncbi:MAG: S8 family serine peptidase [Candidatus Eiseniibacteriota bacterium]
MNQSYGYQNEYPIFQGYGRFSEDTNTLCAWYASARARGNSGVIVGIVDSGIDATHLDLAHTYSDDEMGQRILPGKNFVDDHEEDDVWDDYGHGTQMAGIAAAITDNGPSYFADTVPLGVAGIVGGWSVDEYGLPTPDSVGCRILPVRVSNDLGIWAIEDLAAGIEWAAENGARVINISLGIRGYEPNELLIRPIRLALENAMAYGATCVAGMGNVDSLVAYYPARFAEWGLCIAVGATDLCGYTLPGLAGGLTEGQGSTHGPWIDIVAPGHVVRSTFPTMGNAVITRGASHYVDELFGTSLSTAMVSGVAASLVSVNPILDDVDIKYLLRGTAQDISHEAPDYQGMGRVNHSGAVDLIDPGRRGAVTGDVATNASIFDVEYNTSITIRSADGLIPDGEYTADRYELHFPVTFEVDFVSTPKVWIRTPLTRGWSNANPHYFDYGQGHVDAITTKGALLRTYVYQVEVGEELRWIPCSPDDAMVDYRAAGVIGGVTAVEFEESDRVARLRVRTAGMPARQGRAVRFELLGRPTSDAKLSVWGVAGRLVEEIQGRTDSGGLLSLAWNGRDRTGAIVPPGVYFCRATLGEDEARVRVVIVR